MKSTLIRSQGKYSKEAHVGAWDKTYIPVKFSDSRLKSASVSALLDKGESLSHELNLSHWLLKEVNQSRKLKGEFQFVLTYENESCSYCPDDQRNIWSGFLETPPVIVSFRLPATLELHVKIISARPIGWGVLYIADVIEERNGQPHEFGRSMHFTLTSEHIELPASTELVLFLEDSGTFNETYLQPCNCSETDEKAIWHIKDFRVFIDEINTK